MRASIGFSVLVSLTLGGCFAAFPDSESCELDAQGVGDCRLLLGWTFEDGRCTSVGGCECVGDDCDALFNSEAACREVCGGEPPPTPTPTPAPSACDAQDAHGAGRCSLLAGFAWNGEACDGISCSCVGADCEDIFETLDGCEAAYSACLPSAPPSCEPEVMGPLAFAPVCRPGAEEFYFTERGCEAGCQCLDGTGAYGWPERCPPRYATLETCLGAHAACNSACVAAEAVGLGECNALFGWTWSVREGCAAVQGCECQGPGCENLFESEAACETFHAGCEVDEPLCRAFISGPVDACTTGPDVWWWTEAGCEPGCPCEEHTGRCAQSWGTLTACLGAHRGCMSGECAPSVTERPCRPLERWAWSGTVCAPVTVCGGSSLYDTEAACAAAHTSCRAVECDRSLVGCRAIEPTCPGSMVAEVVGSCWGECVPFAACAPIACEGPSDYRCPGDGPCVGGWCASPSRD